MGIKCSPFPPRHQNVVKVSSQNLDLCLEHLAAEEKNIFLGSIPLMFVWWAATQLQIKFGLLVLINTTIYVIFDRVSIMESINNTLGHLNTKKS